MGNVQNHKGTIVKALAGYYYVAPSVGDGLVQCRARGIFKKRGQSPLVGDDVEYAWTDNGEGIINEIHPRTSELVRPPVANATLVTLVFAVTEPTLNLQLLDKFLVHIEHSGLEAVLCLSKIDLASSEERSAEEARLVMEDVKRIYGAIGYDIYTTSAVEADGIEALRSRLQQQLTVFAGQSGVGKSSLLNALVPGIDLETNAISQRLGRGKHTTRHVELIQVGNGFVADTPGFSQLDFVELGVEQLADCFREFAQRADSCKFRGCTHTHEPECAVRIALAAGEIDPSRMASYEAFLAEMKERKRRY